MHILEVRNGNALEKKVSICMRKFHHYWSFKVFAGANTTGRMI